MYASFYIKLIAGLNIIQDLVLIILGGGRILLLLSLLSSLLLFYRWHLQSGLNHLNEKEKPIMLWMLTLERLFASVSQKHPR